MKVSYAFSYLERRRYHPTVKAKKNPPSIEEIESMPPYKILSMYCSERLAEHEVVATPGPRKRHPWQDCKMSATGYAGGMGAIALERPANERRKRRKRK